MAQVLVYRSLNFGPQMVFRLPAGSREQPQYAFDPAHGPSDRAMKLLHAKAPGTGWQEWAQELARRLPRLERWYFEDVPDRATLAEALAMARDNVPRLV